MIYNVVSRYFFSVKNIGFLFLYRGSPFVRVLIVGHLLNWDFFPRCVRDQYFLPVPPSGEPPMLWQPLLRQHGGRVPLRQVRQGVRRVRRGRAGLVPGVRGGIHQAEGHRGLHNGAGSIKDILNLEHEVSRVVEKSNFPGGIAL